MLEYVWLVYVTVIGFILGDHVKDRFQMELLRMGFDMQNAWRVSEINNNYKWGIQILSVIQNVKLMTLFWMNLWCEADLTSYLEFFIWYKPCCAGCTAD